jgi:hypothetical protein
MRARTPHASRSLTLGAGVPYEIRNRKTFHERLSAVPLRDGRGYERNDRGATETPWSS